MNCDLKIGKKGVAIMALELNKDYFYIDDGEVDAYLFHEGTNYRSYEFMGVHPYKRNKIERHCFAIMH